MAMRDAGGRWPAAADELLPGCTGVDLTLSASLDAAYSYAQRFLATASGTAAEPAFSWSLAGKAGRPAEGAPPAGEVDDDDGLFREAAGQVSVSVGGLRYHRFRAALLELLNSAALTVGGNITASANLTVVKQLLNSGEVSATPAAPTQHDWSPTGLADVGVLLVTPTANTLLTGLTGVAQGRHLLVINFNSSGYNLTLGNENTGSTATNRFKCIGGVDRVLAPSDAVLLAGAGSASRWYVI